MFTTVTIHDDFDSVEDVWRHLQASEVATPYQSISWCRAWARSAGLSGQERICIIVAYDSTGVPIVLLPLAVRRLFGLNVAGFPGGSHVNAGLPLLSRDAHLTERDLERLLRETARIAPPIDLFLLRPIPGTWARAVACIPFTTIDVNPSPSIVARIPGPRDPARATADARLRRLRQLLTRHGTVDIVTASKANEIEQTLHAFLAHKVLWFKERRLRNPFLRPGVQAFLRELFISGNPAFQLHALKIDGAIIAVAGVGRSLKRSYLMFVSYDAHMPAARASPGIYLTGVLVSEATLRDDHTFDFGIGDASYKSRLGGRPETAFVLLRATSVLGRLVRPLVAAAFVARTMVKRRPSRVPA